MDRLGRRPRVNWGRGLGHLSFWGFGSDTSQKLKLIPTPIPFGWVAH